MSTATLIHQANVNPDTGIVQFTFKAGDTVLVGQVDTVEEYANYLTVFQAWTKAELPEPADLPWDEVPTS